MKSSPQMPKDAAFSLIEIAVVAAIIGILAALAIPAFKRSQDNTKIGALQNDLRVYEQEFESFELQNKYFPPSQPNAGFAPIGMEERLPDTWKLPSPVGGTYRWVYTTEDNPALRSAYIEIINTVNDPIVLSMNRLKEIDEEIDDGITTSGQFQLSGLNMRYYIRN